ncbi:hypothetical protein GCK32_013719 [Trichostrongylus colubriformis]|uniref:ShKT domain-containing protein n=1 Tax=Trichostrongylus colubriformis TaxID=6319 RepID=A0AAN8IY10_TRICO
MRSVLITVATLATLVVADLDFHSWWKGIKGDKCKDNDPDYCAAAIPEGFCMSKYHTKKEIKARCRKSCNMCCRDRDKSRCKKYRDEDPNFCNTNSITRDELKMVCGKTCHLCNDNPEEYKTSYLFKKTVIRT